MPAMNSLLTLVRKNLDTGKVTITDLATECQCSREYIYKMLRGDSHPTLPMAERLAGAVGAEITVKQRRRKKVLN